MTSNHPRPSPQMHALVNRYLRGELSRRDFLRAAIAVGGLTAVQAILAACAPAPAPSAPAAGSSAQTGATPQAGAASAAEPKMLIYAASQDIPTIDPSDRTDYSIGAVSRQLYDRLFRFEGGWPQPIEPCLCESYQGSDDATEWTFKLTDKAVFHNGDPVTAEAVVYSYQRTLRFQKQRSSLIAPFLDEDGIQAVDDRTVRMVLKSPFGDFPRLLAFHEQPIMNPKQVKEHEQGGDEGAAWLVENEAGSGPFVIKEWEPGNRYVLEAVPDYWQGWPGESRLAGFVWRIIRETADRRIALLAGEVDIADTISTDDIDIIDNTPGYHVEENFGLLAGYVKMNNQMEPTSDLHFRKFIAYAMDYEALVNVLGGHAKLMTGPIPEGVPYQDPNVQPQYRHDLEKAKEHLDQTPWKDGGIELDYVYVTGLDFEEQLGLILLEQLGKFNIKVNMVPKVWPDMVAACGQPETGPHLINIFVDSGPIPYNWFVEQWYSKSWNRETGGSFQTCDFYSNPEVDTLVETLRGAVDPAEQERIVKELQQIIMEDIPGLPVYVLPSLIGLSDKVRGYVFYGDISVDFWRLWLADA